ncbi:MAG: dTMP kinase [Bdellovibrionota bacterium]
MSSKALFVSFEGIEGSGKSTQIKALDLYFRNAKKKVLCTREPGGTDLGEKLRHLFKSESLTPRCELLLVAAARAQHVDLVLNPALATQDLILCDRYIDSSVAYQAAGRSLGVSTIDWINDFATQGLRPDVTIYLDLSVEDSVHRLNVRQGDHRDRFEQEQKQFHQQVRQAYLDLAAREPQRVVLVDASQDPSKITGILLQVLSDMGIKA